MRNKPHPERQCRRKIRREFRRMMRNDPDEFRAAVDTFIEIAKRCSREPQPEKP